MPSLNPVASPLSVPLTGNPLDRADALRDRSEAISEFLRAPEAKLLTLWGGKAAIDLSEETEPKLLWTDATDAVLAAGLTPPVFLGLENGAGRFAIELPETVEAESLGFWPKPVKFIDLRSIGADLPGGEAAVFAEAKSILSWHLSHRFCAKCGAESVMGRGGWRRDCPRCDAKHFPRTDPVVIMLVEHVSEQHGPRLAVGRQPHWPEGMYSLLAGYIEPGESVEEAVRRETLEESGVTVGRVEVLASQPWPFPSTLMIGCYAEALTEALTPDYTELEDVRWVSLEEMRQVLAGAHPTQKAPRRDAIARVLVEAWVDKLSGR